MTKNADFPRFSDNVPASGYRWWYVDGSSEDGQHHIVIIAFIGSVFSPFYKRAVARGLTDPLDYCAINVALYSKRHARWVMTECPQKQVHREPHLFGVSNTQLEFSGETLTINIDESAAPIPQRVKGRVRVHLQSQTSTEFDLDARKRHQWWPFSPSTKVEVEFEKPSLRWSGNGYFDTNRGAEPLHEGFNSWHWSRAHLDDNTHLTYNAIDRSGKASSLGLKINAQGETEHTAILDQVPLPASTIWRAPRAAHLSGQPKVARTLEDTPFYARSILSNNNGEQTMHESLSLTRFRANWVTTLIPFRMRFPLRRFD
ncbi:MAG: carotenoid 1,2-hydratase [Gammaproteobacteria bacterium]